MGCRVAQLGFSACRVLGSKGFSVCRVWGSKGFSVCRALGSKRRIVFLGFCGRGRGGWAGRRVQKPGVESLNPTSLLNFSPSA